MGDILFLHIPKSSAQPNIMFIPLGTLALANYLKKNGHNPLVVNSFVEKKINPDFDPAKYAKEKGYKTICMPLHWHFQTYDVLETAKKIKSEIPDSKIILGGFTASYFADDIMADYDFIDFVIRGDAEVPLLSVADGKDPASIPNLVWRKENRIFINPQHYKLDKEMFDSLTFTDFSLISNFDEYKKLGLHESDRENSWLFVYNPGVGCPVNCSYCGGSCSSQKRINTREGTIFAKPDKVIQELKNLAEQSIGVWYVCFDPDNDRSYYLEIFRRIQSEGLRMRCKFEAWSLPDREFIGEFRNTFEEGSEIMLSPDSGSEKVRRENKGFFYTNEKLIDSIREMEDKGIIPLVYFTAGLPGESFDDFIETLDLINQIRNDFKSARLFALPIEMEPGSPVFMDNEKYKIKTSRKTINDFYAVHRKQSRIGYETEHFSQEDIAEIANLARAACSCIMKRPAFHKILKDPSFPKEGFPLDEIHKFCAICTYFNRCFA